MVKDEYEVDNESNQQPTITRDKLYNSLFELADIWCPDIEADQYKNFFESLDFRF